MVPYNQSIRQQNFFNRPSESPILTAGAQIVKNSTAASAGTLASLPALGKQTVGSVNETKDTIDNVKEVSRRSSNGFSVRKPKMGEADFDYSSLNMNLRLRDLETKLVDLKGDMERRVLQIIEEAPMKFLSQLKQIEEKETTMWADNMDKHNKSSEALMLHQARSGNQLDQVVQRMFAMQKQLEDLTYKNTELERNISNLSVPSSCSNPLEAQPRPPGQQYDRTGDQAAVGS